MTATVTAVDDSVIEGGDETVVVTASHGGEVGSATVTIEDNDTPTWSVTAEPARVAEGAESTITVSAGKAFAVEQTITLAAGGTAASEDYSLSSSSLTLDAGDTSVTATVTAVDDSVIEGGDETVVVTASHSGGAVGSATVTIEDNDTPTWSVTAEPARVAEGAESTITVSAGKAFAVEQTITLAATGTAASGDYSLSSSSLTLDAGDTSVTATVTAVDDSDEESDETVVVTASHDGAVGSATVTIEANDTPVSTDAALSSLALSGVSIGDFDAGTTAYAASVDNGVSSTTLTAVASDDGASVVITDGDGETQGTSRSVSLVVGDNEITVTVTAEDATTTKTYTITVTRAVAPLPPGVVWGDRLADRDIALPGAPTGVWSDGTDVWVVTTAGKISVYSLADGAEHTDRGFALPGGAEYAAGLWSNGATLWVADVNSGWVRAYRLSDGARQADRDLNTAALAAAGNTEPRRDLVKRHHHVGRRLHRQPRLRLRPDHQSPRRRQRTRPRQEPRRDLQPLRHLVQRRHAAGRLLVRQRDHRPQPHRRAAPTSQRPLHPRQQNQLPQRHLVQRPHPLDRRHLRRNPLRLRRPRPRRTTQRHGGLRRLAVSSYRLRATPSHPRPQPARVRERPLQQVAASPGQPRPSRSNSWVLLTLFVQSVRIQNRRKSHTISSGGFSSASEYWRSWSEAASRLLPGLLYSPGEMMPLLHVGPAIAAGVFTRALWVPGSPRFGEHREGVAHVDLIDASGADVR